MKVWNVMGNDLQAQSQMEQQLEEAADVVRRGGLVAFPTETVYGLGADATNEDAVRKIFAAKQRPADNPLIVHISNMEMLAQVTPAPDALPAPVRTAMRHFWPGPLTVIVPASPTIAPSVRPGMDTIGVRMPAHPLASELIRRAGCPMAAPSANSSGKPSPTTAADVAEDMEGRIDGIVDGGACDVGVESTVVAIEADRATIYRPGGVTAEQLSAVLGIPVHMDAHLTTPTEAPKSPGMKYRHYAPNASVHVWWGSVEGVADAMRDFITHHDGEHVAVVVPAALEAVADQVHHRYVASPDADYAEQLSRELYRLLRAFDRAGVSDILVAGVAPDGLGAAVMNRLQKASEGRLYRV